MRHGLSFKDSRSVTISIHASYANDATHREKNPRTFLKYFNPRIVRKRCDDQRIDLLYCQVDFNPRIVRKRCDLMISGYRIRHRDFNPRIVRKRCDYFFVSHISALLIHFNPRIVRKRCDLLKIRFRHNNAEFQSTHRTQTMRLWSAGYHADGRYFNPRIVRKRCDIGQLNTIKRVIKISIHASYANDATRNWHQKIASIKISIHASYANDAT